MARLTTPKTAVSAVGSRAPAAGPYPQVVVPRGQQHAPQPRRQRRQRGSLVIDAACRSVCLLAAVASASLETLAPADL